MQTRISPLAAAVKARLANRKSIAQIADRMTVIEPASETIRPPSIFLESELDKVTRVGVYTTMEIERGRIYGGKEMHAPLIRYELSDAIAFPFGFTVKDHSFERFGEMPLRLLATGNVTHVRRAHYSGTTMGAQFFGHCIRDSCATTLLTRDDEALILPHQQNWTHWEEYRSIFALNPLPLGLIHVDELVFHSDYAQGRSRIQRYHTLRAMVREALPAARLKGAGKRIFLHRGATGAARVISNEIALVDALTSEGFEFVDIAQANVSKIMDAAMDAELCVTMEGSHQIHAFLFLKHDGILVNIQPSDRLNCVVNDFIPPIGMRYAFVVGMKGGAGYHVDIPALLKTIDLAEHARAVAR